MFDQEAGVPYAYRDKEWVSYEDEQSITSKAQWIQKNGFGGAMIFSLNEDDWQGVYGDKFPLITTLHGIISTSGSN